MKSVFPIFSGDGMAAIIARRLLGVMLLFVLLDIGLVLVSYVRDREGLGQRLLTIQAEEVAEAITVTDGKPAFDPARVHRESIGDAKLAFAVYDRQGKTVAKQGPWALAHTLVPPLTAISSETRRNDHANGFVLRGVRRVMASGEPFWIAMVVEGQGLRPFLPVILGEMGEHVGVPLLPLVLLLLVLNVTAVRRTLQPLSAAVDEVETLQPGQLERRLAMPEGPREVRRLVGALNEALGRIERGIRALKDFTGDAAHELRTPLAIMSMEVDGLPDSPSKYKLRSDLDTMTRSVSQMLDMASADALLIDNGARVDLNEAPEARRAVEDRHFSDLCSTAIDIFFSEASLGFRRQDDCLFERALAQGAAVEDQGLVEVDVGFDEAAEDEASPGVVDRRVSLDARGDRGDASIGYAERHRFRRAGQPRIGDDQIERHRLRP